MPAEQAYPTLAGEPATGASPVASSQGFDGFRVTALSQVKPQLFATNQSCTFTSTNVCANDIWGYVSPAGREYAILGLLNGTGFVDITDPANPVIVGSIADSASIWSDMRTLDTYAYNVNESGGGMQVIDLSLIDPPSRSVSLVGSFTGSGLQTAHNLTMNVESRHAYLCGSNLGGGRLVAVSLADPTSPQIVGQAIDSGYVHDAEVITYTDGPYAGREIAFCYSAGAGLKILDVTNKTNMFTVSTFDYPDLRYCHQGRITPDRRYVILDDELDELQDPDIQVTTTRVVDVSDLSNPTLVRTFTTGLRTIDHNLMVRGDFVFEANYTSGLRVFNIAQISGIFEAGYFDTYPYNNGLSFNGAWGVFADFPSGVVIVSDIQNGLFVFDVSEAEAALCPFVESPGFAANWAAKPRYLSIRTSNFSQRTALRVTLANLPAPFEAFNGTAMWVAAPELLPNPKNTSQLLRRSRLTCSPVYMNWASLGDIEISDDEIVPGGEYDVREVHEQCGAQFEDYLSPPLRLAASAPWGDVVGGNGNGPPDGQVDVLDVSAMVDSLKGLAGSPDVAEADVFPSETDFVINVLDVASVVDALKGFPYPFVGPVGCP